MDNKASYYIINEDEYQLIIYHNTESLLIEDNADVEVILKDGKRYTATVFTIDNIQKLMNKYTESGECHNGTYFWATDMIIIRDLNIKTIQETVSAMVMNKELEMAFATSNV